MSEDRNGLFNFSQLRRKTEEYNTISSKHSNSCGIDFDIDSNQQIMKSFKELRDKLKTANKENIGLKDELKSVQVQFRQSKEAENYLTSANHQLKDRVSQLEQSNEQWRKRILLMKQELSQRDALKEEVKYLKQSLIDLKSKNEDLEEERKKLIQISIEDKIFLEEQISKLQAKKQSDEQYLIELQADLSKAKQTIHNLENSLKRLEIKYEQEIYNKQWSKNNFEKEHYEKKVTQLQAALSDSKTKNRKQKQKRAELQKRLLQLQQITGLCSVKAYVYEGEVELMTKKVKKMQRKISQARLTAHKMADQKVNWEQKFTKTVYICEELINRVKREVMGDMVELAKTCEYKLNRLKDSKEESSKQTERFSSSKKYRTDKKSRNSVQKENTLKNDYSYKKVYLEAQSGKILFESDQNRPKEEPAKPLTNTDQSDKQSETTTSFSNIQIKIRKQRDQMQKILKQKMLYRRMQVSTSPNKTKLREDYLKLMEK